MRTLSLVASTALAVAAWLYAGALPAHGSTAPHVPTATDTDACAICHRGHTSASDAWTEGSRFLNPLSNALLTVPALGVGDTALCFACHGVGQLGSDSDVESAFGSRSHHSIAPSSSAYGPSPKQCSSCHDSHGSMRTAEDTTYPALLRVYGSDGTPVFSGEQMCGTCHEGRPLDTFDGLSAWRDTAHAGEMTSAPDGTRILCLNCHDAHGSPVAPSIRTELTTPSAPATFAVVANDRTLCFGCHAQALNTYSGETTYAATVHASSSATAAISGEWPARDLNSLESSRTVGECQVCHNPMGRSDGAGGALPKMVDRFGRQLCDQCHRAAGPAESVIASLAYPTSRNDTELVAVWAPSTETSGFSEVSAWTTDVTTTVPAGLNGPRVFDPAGVTGDAATGDVDGDGIDDLIVANPTAATLTLYRGDAVQGLRRSTLVIPSGEPAHLVLVADVINQLPGPVTPGPTQSEIVVVSRDPAPPNASQLYVFTYDGTALSTIDIDPGAGVSLPVGDDASSIAVGDLVGSSTADVVVTARASDSARVFSEQVIGALEQIGGAHPTGPAPRGVSVGDVWGDNSGNEIALCSGLNSIEVLRADGVVLGTLTAAGSAPATFAYDSLVADVLWGESPAGTSGAELVVSLRTDPTTSTVSGTSSINVFRQAAGGAGLQTGGGWPQTYTTGLHYESSTLAAGDVDLDGREELAVGNAGKWARLGSLRQPPSVQVFDSTNGTTFSATPKTLWANGVEAASGLEESTTVLPAAPPVLIADLGPVGPSRHPGDAAGPGSHVSTESADFTRHVTCADCHNVHETTATVPSAPATMYGAIRGAWGTEIVNTAPGAGGVSYSTARRADREYEVCLKCHSANAGWSNARNVAAEVNPLNPSTHAIQLASTSASTPVSTFETVPANTFVNNTSSWTATSRLYCIDCHTNADTTQARGPHVSSTGALLRKPYLGTLPSSDTLLCYVCHRYEVYYGGSAGSLFRDFTAGIELHQLHANQGGFSCRICHSSHGSTYGFHLQVSASEYTHSGSGGACVTACHTAGANRSYSRDTVTPPSAYSMPVQSTSGGYPLGDALASILTSDSVSLEVRELATPVTFEGTTSNLEFRTTFTGVSATPSAFTFVGWYDGKTAGHTVRVEAYDFVGSSWVSLGLLPSTTAQTRRSYPIADSRFVSGAGEVRVRIVHLPPGSSAHFLNVNAVWLTP